MDIQATLDALLTDHHDKLDTRAVLIGPGALDAPGVAAIATYLGAGPWLVAVDAHTWEAAGARLTGAIDAAGHAWERYDVPDGHDSPHPMCDDASVEAFEAALARGTYTGAIAVGSGTINDVVKLAAHRAGVPVACAGTAPSMNGYTSKIAAVLSDGVKTTVPCTAPRVVLADLDVMCDAPPRMIASGLGDLISKPVSNADWQLSASLNDTFHSAEAMEIIERGAAMLEGCLLYTSPAHET